MLFSSLGLLATLAIGVASQESLLPCGNAFYVSSQYTCYANDTLCPVLYGQATQPCGADCYLDTMYSCNNGKLAPPVPSVDGTFLVIALQSPYFDSVFVQASGFVFFAGGGPPSTYCPDEVAQLGACPAGTETVWTCASGFCGLNVEVPGGQQIYVAPNGAVSYTLAHSGVAPDGSSFSGFNVTNGELRFEEFGFQACPAADGSTTPQLYVAYSEVQIRSDCYDVKLVTATGNEPGFAAWQYT